MTDIIEKNSESAVSDIPLTHGSGDGMDSTLGTMTPEVEKEVSVSKAEPEKQGGSEIVESVNLKDANTAAFLALIFPGLGHWYQGRYAKAILYCVCIMGLFFGGIGLSSTYSLGTARAVYFSFRPGDMRYYYLAQMWVGVPAVPALLQAVNDPTGHHPLCGGFMAPPLSPSSPDELVSPNAPTLDNIRKKLHRYFELATIFTVTAGLLNLLVIFDAWSGPISEEGITRFIIHREEAKKG